VGNGAYIADFSACEFEGAMAAVMVGFADEAADNGICVFRVVQDERCGWPIGSGCPVDARSDEKVGMFCYVVK